MTLSEVQALIEKAKESTDAARSARATSRKTPAKFTAIGEAIIRLVVTGPSGQQQDTDDC